LQLSKTINLSSLGPGLLFAAVSVGLSHLVQSTRAGAMFGLALFIVVILANLFKYPAFRFGSDYAGATGTTLLEGYRRRGRWALVFFAITSCSSAFFAVSAIALIAAGALKGIFGLSINITALASSVLLVTAIILIMGHYRWLERIAKALVIVISITTVIAALLVTPDIRWGGDSLLSVRNLEVSELLFIAALVGFMPSPLDAAVWQSLWTCAKAKSAGHAFTKKDIGQDFVIGYVGCTIVALCFLVLGAGLMHSRGIPVESSAGPFTAQLIRLYTEVLGDWTFPMIAVGVFAVMYSSLLAGLDAVSRSVAVVVGRLRGPESEAQDVTGNNAWYIGAMLTLVLGPLALQSIFRESLTQIIDVAACVAFVSAPVLAYLNHRCMQGSEIPENFRPTEGFFRFSAFSIFVLASFGAVYLYIRFLL
jgi:Mn2+/Fe2+ NRAMP family transporter